MNIGERLRKAILDSGMTHYAIAKVSGVGISVIDRFVSGERQGIRLDTAERLARAINRPLALKG